MLEPNSEGGTKTIETSGPVEALKRNKVESIFMARNCVLEDTWLPEVLETDCQGDAKTVQTHRFVTVTRRSDSEVNCVLVPRNSILEVGQLSEALETCSKGGA